MSYCSYRFWFMTISGLSNNENQFHCACALCVFHCLMHFKLLFDHSAMNDGTRKTLSVNDCLMSAKQ